MSPHGRAERARLRVWAKSDWTLKIGDREAANVSDKATVFEICYDRIWFDGEAKADTGKACDDKRKMGSTSSAGSEAKSVPADHPSDKATAVKAPAKSATPATPAAKTK